MANPGASLPAGGNTRLAPMVGWYDPGQLTTTGVEVLISTIFGKNADYRLIEALGAGELEMVDYTVDETGRPRSELWIDFIADTGDGWNPTYAIARTVGQPDLYVRVSSGSAEPEYRTCRGDILVFGGDEVYPTAGRDPYDQKLVRPFECALRETEPPHPDVYAIPGNHDWYDSLVAFSRLFCQGRWFAGWRTRQRRSYFALKLPHGWWLLGTDVQLESDLDYPQLEYFRAVAKQMQDDDRVILCNAEPHWIYAKIYGKDDTDYHESTLAFLEQRVLNHPDLDRTVTIPVFLSGDLHHYRRHATDDGGQKITAGGGGAFLHPTHGPDVGGLSGGYRLRASFPDTKTSRRLCWLNLGFLWRNPWFGAVPGFLYLLCAWTIMADFREESIRSLGGIVRGVLSAVLGRPGGAFWILLIFFGFVLFTDVHSRLFRWIAGPVHGMAHLLATLALGWGSAYVCVVSLGLPFRSIPQLLISAVAIVVGGWIVGSVIMGLYLLISLNGFNAHLNEAFSSLAIPDWKNFLRLQITGDGTLTIYPIGIRRVPRRWRETRTPAGSFDPDDPEATLPELIEGPIRVGRGSRESIPR